MNVPYKQGDEDYGRPSTFDKVALIQFQNYVQSVGLSGAELFTSRIVGNISLVSLTNVTSYLGGEGKKPFKLKPYPRVQIRGVGKTRPWTPPASGNWWTEERFCRFIISLLCHISYATHAVRKPTTLMNLRFRDYFFVWLEPLESRCLVQEHILRWSGKAKQLTWRLNTYLFIDAYG